MTQAEKLHPNYIRFFAYALTFVSGAFFALALHSLAENRKAELTSRSMEVKSVELPSEQHAELSVVEPIEMVSYREVETHPVEQLNKSKKHQEDACILVVSGITEPAVGRFAKVPLATSQSVAFVDATLGTHVKKGWQLFSHWESPERLQVAKTEITKAKKLCEIASLKATAADSALERMRSIATGSVSESEYENAETNANIRRKEVEAATLYVEELEGRFAALKFEFEQAFVTSPIDGVVTSVDVIPGERRTLTGAFRGVTILDTNVLHCRCLLNSAEYSKLQKLLAHRQLSSDNVNQVEPQQVDEKRAIAVSLEQDGSVWPGRFLTIGVHADKSELIPVMIEVANPQQKLLCGVQVEVTLQKVLE